MMKKSVLSTLLLALVFSIAFVSCKKKDKDKDPEPTPAAETNYVNISGTNYKLYPDMSNLGTLYFYGNTSTTPGTYPYIEFDFGNNPLPTSTTTYNGILRIYKGNSGADIYVTTMDFKIIAQNGEYSISFPSSTFKNNSNEGITCSGNITYKQ